MTTKKVWTLQEMMQLTEKYKENRELWDTTSKNYRNKLKIKSILKSLAKEFNTTDQEINKKLYNLKSQFDKKIKEIQQRESGHGKRDFFETMQFTTFQPRPAVTGDSMDNAAQVEEFIERSNRRLKIIKRRQQNDQLARAAQILNKPRDEFQIFGDYVASAIRKMHFDIYKGELMRKIQSAMIQYTELDDKEYYEAMASRDLNDLE